MLKEWPGCFDDLFCVQNVSNSGHLPVSSARFVTGYPIGFGCPATSPKRSAPWPFCTISFASASFFISELFSVFVVSYSGSVPAKMPSLARANCLTTTSSPRVLPVVFDCLQPITSRPREELASTPTQYGMIENMSRAILAVSAYFECVSSCWRQQSVMSGTQNVLLISIGSEW